MAHSSDEATILSGVNAEFIAGLYARWLDDPAGVDDSWAAFFADLKDDSHTLLRELSGASWTPPHMAHYRPANGELAARPSATAPPLSPSVSGVMATPRSFAEALANPEIKAALDRTLAAIWLIRSYRVRGHLEADLDPLQMAEREDHPDLRYQTYGLSEADLDKPVYLAGVMGLETATLRQVLEVLRETYCGTIGVEYMHIQDLDKRRWVEQRAEASRNKTYLNETQKRRVLERLIEAETFERFLDRKYVGTKRFGLDGGEAMVAGLTAILRAGTEVGVGEVVIGMSHRGRLNVLANVLHKPYELIFSEFQGGAHYAGDVQGSGDVKYHLGTSTDREFDGKKLHISLSANPSHLEAVDPVVLGKVRAKQAQWKDSERAKVMGIVIHGDAAFAGQGLVAETLDLSGLKGYEVGGTIHFIINNQIGFTTAPKQQRSSPYCSDVAKGVQAPIFHVNGDDPEAVVHVCRMAVEYRQRFGSDVVIDMFCYRRHGHNEGDEPTFTQPLMYKQIATHKPVTKVYGQRLVAEGLVAESDLEGLVSAFEDRLNQAFDAAVNYRPNRADWLEGAWSKMKPPADGPRRGRTGVDISELRAIGRQLTTPPHRLNVHRNIRRQLDAKHRAIDEGAPIDWALGEALAFGTLVREGVTVRLSGQDSGRGTFSHRHSVLVDQETEEKFVPLNNLQGATGVFEVVDSPLSEAGVLGFEYGFTLADPGALVLWEAQFGDFANGAQVIIDQFISAGEAKWLRMSGLVMLLPHGYEGQGPEHSSARLERFLQLCAEDNMQVVNCTTPANFFHVLRRQMHRDFRKPLIVMTPKSLLRHRRAVSTLDDMGPDSTFHRVLFGGTSEDTPGNEKTRRVVLCSGKVYYDLLAEQEKRETGDILILRLEQLYPFPDDVLRDVFAKCSKAEIIWCQEEPRNMGAWTFVAPLIEETALAVDHTMPRPRYVGRAAAAAPATGLLSRHNKEQATLVSEALS
ncbi:MAG: 2-oxoglutarate dehydrogenase E1 component [Alphaproteobacteria bacterium]